MKYLKKFPKWNNAKFVTVFITIDPGLLAIATSVLEDSGINFLVFNNNPLEFMSLGAEIKVDELNLEGAKELLKDLM
ncbi:MAG: DUF2007 domain-containing protein [Candidatus Cloacimonadales bacterium]|nr:DUF2007 domain-containing protein [Candidatus Cloacimonadales bacterium]